MRTLFLIFGLLLPLVSACASGPRPVPAPEPVAHVDLGHDHIPNPRFPHAPYNSNPGTSGSHTPYTAPWGVHEKPVPPEVFIHNLEHGGIVIGYRCPDECPELAEQLARYAEDRDLVIVAPNPALDSPIVLAAWAHTLSLSRLDDTGRAAIERFLESFYGVDHHPPGGHPHSAPPSGGSPAP
ncbi:MAG: DUF3105 domain-containing protein [Nitrospirota bacterium]|nr:DUF3105 domain-containing protein [Nitrospirota bacterium]